MYTWVSAAALREGRTTGRGAAEILITIEGRTRFGLAVDPIQRRLIPTILYGAAAVAG
jgi:hypothetical protein